MSEIRKHYFLSEYCIIAEERAKRPSDFADADENIRKNDYNGNTLRLLRTPCTLCYGRGITDVSVGRVARDFVI